MNETKQDTLRFTFFVSGVDLIANQYASYYKNPAFLILEDRPGIFPEMSRFKNKKFPDFGISNIEFGGTVEEVKERVGHINQLHESGNEIASHAVGHFHGGKWTKNMWQHEMVVFNDVIHNVGEINHDDSIKLNFTSDDIVGFRAPYLEGNKGLLSTLTKLNYKYDASDTEQGLDPTSWPKPYNLGRNKRIWNFGLGFIKSYGKENATRIPSMDYNFCFRYDKGCREKYPEALVNNKENGQKVLLSYIQYFLDNYNNNRAPIHIGHHFRDYQGGVYTNALFTFAKLVCTKPEVKCVTYKTLSEFMENHSEEEIQNFQKGIFPKLDSKLTFDELVAEIK